MRDAESGLWLGQLRGWRERHENGIKCRDKRVFMIGEANEGVDDVRGALGEAGFVVVE